MAKYYTPENGWETDVDGQLYRGPHTPMRIYDAATVAGRAQVEQLTDTLAAADARWNDETGDDALDRDYLAHAARAVLNALRGDSA